MDVSKPFTAISSSVDVDVLVVLAGSTKPRSGRELARRAVPRRGEDAKASRSTVTARKQPRAQACGEPQARQRLGHAQSFLEVAELAADVSDPSLEYGSVAASVAILAGIAAADAASCKVWTSPGFDDT